MAKLNDNQKSLLILGGGILFAIGFGVLAYLHYGDYRTVRADIEAKTKTRDENKVRIDKAKSLKYEVVAYGKIVEDNAAILPTEDYLNAFVRDLSTLEKETGVSIKALPRYVPAKDRKDPTITKSQMKLQLSGSTRNFLQFLNQLENRERLVSVTDIRVNPANEKEAAASADPEHEYSLTFEVYKYDPGKQKQDQLNLISEAEIIQLRDDKQVKDILKNDGKPTYLERYRLLRVKESRRDPFLDPRRRTGKGVADTSGDGGKEQEVVRLEQLLILVGKAQVELQGYREAEKSRSDFLRLAAAKRAFVGAKEALEQELTQVSAKSPEFNNRDLQDRYALEVKRPYEQLLRDSGDITTREGTQPMVLTEEMCRTLRADMKAIMDARKFGEAVEKWINIDSVVREAGKKVEDGARPVIEEMRKMGEHAQFQSLLSQRKISVQGIVRMSKRAEEVEAGKPAEVSAAIINGRFLKPGDYLEKDLAFRGVEPDGRLLFSLQKHEVDFVQPQPELLQQQNPVLEQQ
ncbi:MAG: type 4a pilus biogenesis protein PilO [Planctomycetaceae bacterium]|nr:type 4a pilus biogenesis protein PilO [Planctomycetota bacterium]NUN51708.1 type 4a pilus biogenesis protein PilO [Planctomycetaceae bacterium]